MERPGAHRAYRAHLSPPETTSGGTRDGVVSDYRFKRGMYLPELRLPLEPALATAREIGAEYVWFSRLQDEPPIADMSDEQVDRVGERIARHGLTLLVVCAGDPFKEVHLAELPLTGLAEHPLFRQHFRALVRSMQIARRLGVGAVYTHAFAWPGEYSANKPTWPMRWLTRGGVIAAEELDKLTQALSLMADEAERYDVDVVLGMLPWHYTNTTGNLRSVVERVGSRRLRAMWGPCDNTLCGEWDVAQAGFTNIRPYLHSLHLKDLHIFDGQRRQFEYRPLGTGDVDYPTIFRQLRRHRCDVVLSVSTHFVPPGGSRIEAMRINYANLERLIRQALDLDPPAGPAGPAPAG
jgi:sugar phosphate isomerase/epimerase